MSMRSVVFWSVTTNNVISVIFVDKNFKAICCLHHQERWWNNFIENVTGWISEPVWIQQRKIPLPPAGNQMSVHSQSLHWLSYPGSSLTSFQ